MNFFLLSLTARLARRKPKTARLMLSSALGGLYALIILVSLPAALSVVLKALCGAVMVAVAFGRVRLKSYLLLCLLFLFASFVLLGVVGGIWLLLKTDRIAVHNGALYLDIGARGLLLSAFFAYVLSCLIVRLHNKRAAAGAVYTLKIERQGQSVTLFALADTGNCLREPFSGYPVIVVSAERVRAIAPKEAERLIPASTVSAPTCLFAFRPDRVTIQGNQGSETAEEVYIALSDEMKADGFAAVFNPEILCV